MKIMSYSRDTKLMIISWYREKCLKWRNKEIELDFNNNINNCISINENNSSNSTNNNITSSNDIEDGKNIKCMWMQKQIH